MTGPRTRRIARGRGRAVVPVPGLALAPALALALALAAAGCGSDRIDPPPDGASFDVAEPTADLDSLTAWAQRAREGWASGEPSRGDAAAALAREVFAGAWNDLAGGTSARERRTLERLPEPVAAAALPAPEDVGAALQRLGLSCDARVATGPVPLWQVIVADPVGPAGAATEFWAWPHPDTPHGPPVVQALPADAPARMRYGPEAAGALLTWSTDGSAGLASAWSRPRGRIGLEVALAARTGGGADARWAVTSNRTLKVEVDAVEFEPDAAGGPPWLVVHGAGARDPLFHDCPTCPRLAREQRYAWRGENWILVEETIETTPYASFVWFLNAMVKGTPDTALPYAEGPAVLEQARALGLDRRPAQPLRAVPGTDAHDATQRYRLPGRDVLEVTFAPRGESWVVADLRLAPDPGD